MGKLLFTNSLWRFISYKPVEFAKFDRFFAKIMDEPKIICKSIVKTLSFRPSRRLGSYDYLTIQQCANVEL